VLRTFTGRRQRVRCGVGLRVHRTPAFLRLTGYACRQDSI
jgi:hypothetical protein